MRIFISYVKEQRSDAERVAFALRAEKHDVFLDTTNLAPGDLYIKKIRDEIQDADYFVFLASEESVKQGRFTLTELDIAQERWPEPGGKVLPVVIGNLPFEKLPDYLSTISALIPKGNIAAEVAAQIAARPGLGSELKKITRKQWFKPIAFLLAGMAGLVIVVIFYLQTVQNQKAAIQSVLTEFGGNQSVIVELGKNTNTLDNLANTVKSILRMPKIKVLAGIFPPENADPTSDPDSLADLYNQRMEWLQSSGLLEDQTEVRRFQEGCAALIRTIENTETTVLSLADNRRQRYVIREDEWESSRQLIKDSSFNNRALEVLNVMRYIRGKYDRIASVVPEYLNSVKAFCSEPLPTRPGLSAVLASERLTVRLLSGYTSEIDLAVESLVELSDKFGDTQL